MILSLLIFKKFLFKCLKAFCWCVLVFMLMHILFPLKVKVNYSTAVLSSEGVLLNAYLNKEDKWRIKTDIKKVSPLLMKTILAKEDKWFYWHFGVNPIAIAKAGFKNIVSAKRVSGASTISMQVARLLEPKKRTFLNKIIELFRATQLEFKYSKDEILELYLNLLPYGSNIEGINAASLIYFGKQPHALSLSESTILAIIPNRPTSLNIKNKYVAILKSRNYWLNYFKENEIFDPQLIADAQLEPINIQKNELPKIAPHLCYRLKTSYSDSAYISNTIKYQLQLQAENILKNYIEKTKAQNIRNGSILVVENKTGNVIIYCGSNNFADNENAGQVDGTQALRSPGSALKPFLYAQAFDMGLYTPNSVLYDVPININGYQPQNYDKGYNGAVTLRQALAYSLNIPAVSVLNEVGISAFSNTLKKTGFSHIKTKNMGLSLALGGCGVTLQELTCAYSTLANYGKYKPLNFLKSEIKNNGINTISEEAAYLTTDILQTLVRPDIPSSFFNNTFRIPKVAWKTGTSYGRKDAWAIGYNKDYTVGVWVGNFDAEGVPSLSGAEIATPLLFEIFNTIDYNSTKKWFAPPKGIEYRYVCSKTGNLPAVFCTDKITDQYIGNKTLQKNCNHLIEIPVNADSSLCYCNSCLPNETVINKFYPNLPATLINYYVQEKIVYKAIPKHNPNCTCIYQTNGPKIVSPSHGSEYLIETESQAQIMLNAEADNKASKILWYVNDKLVKEGLPNQAVFITPPIGNVKITCSDNLGRSSHITIVTKAF